MNLGLNYVRLARWIALPVGTALIACSCSSPSQTPSADTVHVRMLLPVRRIPLTDPIPTGILCAGSLFDEMRGGGTKVTVKDQSGTVIGIGEFPETGVTERLASPGISEGQPVDVVCTFTVDIPVDHPARLLTVGREDGSPEPVTISRDALQAGGWTVTLKGDGY